MQNPFKKLSLRLPPPPRTGRPLAVALFVLIVVALAILLLQSSHRGPEGLTATGRIAAGTSARTQAEALTTPGLLALDDFQVVIPSGWQRRKEMEDEGPGTKLFLAGPTIGKQQLFIGFDVYPLRAGTTLEDFTRQYAARWAQFRPAIDRESRLCDQPARMLGFADAGLDKLFLISIWRNKGFVIGMIGPSGEGQKAISAFREVVDTFQVYE